MVRPGLHSADCAGCGPTVGRCWADFGPELGRLWADGGPILADFISVTSPLSVALSDSSDEEFWLLLVPCLTRCGNFLRGSWAAGCALAVSSMVAFE